MQKTPVETRSVTSDRVTQTKKGRSDRTNAEIPITQRSMGHLVKIFPSDGIAVVNENKPDPFKESRVDISGDTRVDVSNERPGAMDARSTHGLEERAENLKAALQSQLNSVIRWASRNADEKRQNPRKTGSDKERKLSRRSMDLLEELGDRVEAELGAERLGHDPLFVRRLECFENALTCHMEAAILYRELTEAHASLKGNYDAFQEMADSDRRNLSPDELAMGAGIGKQMRELGKLLKKTDGVAWVVLLHAKFEHQIQIKEMEAELVDLRQKATPYLKLAENLDPNGEMGN